MKKLILFSFFLFSSALLWSQQTQDAVHLKNGSIIKGQVIEYTQGEGGQIKIRTADGSLLIYPSTDVVKMEKENVVRRLETFNEAAVDVDDYGHTGIAYGIAIGGGGLFGVPVQYNATPMTALELGLFYRPTIVVNYYDEAEVKGGVMLAGGANFYLKKHYKQSKRKVKLNGISVKAGRSFGDFAQTFFAAGWASEGFRKDRTNQSLVFELGLGVVQSNYSGEGLFYEEPGITPLLYWKLNWKWSAKQR